MNPHLIQATTKALFLRAPVFSRYKLRNISWSSSPKNSSNSTNPPNNNLPETGPDAPIEDPIEIAARSSENAYINSEPKANSRSKFYSGKLATRMSSSLFSDYYDVSAASFIEKREKQEMEENMVYKLHVHSSANNTILSLTDDKGQVLFNTSGGSVGFKKSNRGGFEAAYQATVKIIEKAREANKPIGQIEMRFKGFGPGRNASYKAIRSVTDWEIVRLTDATPIPFNGCRPKKARRL
ncbi:hypothetical protein H4219_000753 [Mycoemilia scoparia]|uniref:Ribosomal protein S11 n=1 Tax=Mycoemilia scoparia TaxID=417184 RepID=A0A9W8AB17_9FUNG|nr:hypothetical protein H4219_000753 [Mycoemilia scoparia]